MTRPLAWLVDSCVGEGAADKVKSIRKVPTSAYFLRHKAEKIHKYGEAIARFICGFVALRKKLKIL